MKVYRCIFDDRSKIEAIAFVKNPAILKHFAFEQGVEVDRQMKFIYDKNIITSPLLIPDQMIYRIDGNEPYYIYYTKADVIAITNYIILNAGKIKFNIEHDNNRVIEGVEFIGVGTTNENLDLNFFQMPENTMFCELLVNNDEVVRMIENKEVQGLSIEGVMTMVEDVEKEIEFEIEKDVQLKRMFNIEVKNKVFKIK